jgi:hypothetical protein
VCSSQIRRQARERREYIYKKAHEAQERAIYDRKQAMKDALASGKPLPTELRAEARTAGRDLKYDEAQTGQSFHRSFQGSWAGISERSARTSLWLLGIKPATGGRCRGRVVGRRSSPSAAS